MTLGLYFYVTAANIVFNPTYWNIVARHEYHYKTISKIVGAYNGCYGLAVTIFSLGIIRDYFYHLAIHSHPLYPTLEFPVLAALLFGLGNVLVLSSMYRLGVTGTYLGDYFGILMTKRVTGFPFNVSTSPMYTGSTMVFVGTALWYGSAVGLALSGLVLACYQVALRLEDPFTTQIYASRTSQKRD